ncbi:hypothetical protein [Ralstonia phage RP31]|uniref:Virion structural protein n=1 Tax=Ralstonia phage RP31 TaxID=1923890 RepID=A0A1L7N1C7_9CAUD|nr:hypothetical protein [Ralstonia phage RP31]
MTIFNSAYATTATAGYSLSKLEQALEQAFYHNATQQMRENVHMVREGLNGGVAGVPAFNFPFVCKFKDGDVAFFDARAYVGVDASGSARVRDAVEVQARTIQAQLALDWHQGYQGRIRDISPLPLMLYAHWMGETVAKRFALDARQQLQVSVFAAIFYLNCFWDKTEASSEDTAYLLSAITRTCSYRHSDVVDIVETHPIIRDVQELCDVIKAFTQSVRLEDFNPATLYGVVGGSWYGNAGRELVTVALEYPPVWLTLLFQAISNRGFKKAGLTQIIERNTYRKYHEGFVRSMAYLGQVQDDGGAGW